MPANDWSKHIMISCDYGLYVRMWVMPHVNYVVLHIVNKNQIMNSSLHKQACLRHDVLAFSHRFIFAHTKKKHSTFLFIVVPWATANLKNTRTVKSGSTFMPSIKKYREQGLYIRFVHMNHTHHLYRCDNLDDSYVDMQIQTENAMCRLNLNFWFGVQKFNNH